MFGRTVHMILLTCLHREHCTVTLDVLHCVHLVIASS